MTNTLAHHEAEAEFLRRWPADGLPEAEHAEQTVAAFDAYLQAHGLKPEGATFHRWQEARALKALIDLQRPAAIVTYLIDGGVVVDDGSSVTWFPNPREAATELSARGLDLPAPRPVAPAGRNVPATSRWAAGSRSPRGGPAATHTHSPEDSRV